MKKLHQLKISEKETAMAINAELMIGLQDAPQQRGEHVLGAVRGCGAVLGQILAIVKTIYPLSRQQPSAHSTSKVPIESRGR